MDINEIFGKIGFDVKMFIFNVVNFLAVLLLFRKFFFDKIVSTLEKRQEIIDQGLTDAERYKTELKMAEQKSDEIIAEAKTKANTIILEGQDEAKTSADRILKDAQEKVEDEKKKAEEQISQSREKMIASLKKETADLAILATEKIIKEKLDEKRDREIIDEYLNQLDS